MATSIVSAIDLHMAISVRLAEAVSDDMLHKSAGGLVTLVSVNIEQQEQRNIPETFLYSRQQLLAAWAQTG